MTMIIVLMSTNFLGLSCWSSKFDLMLQLIGYYIGLSLQTEVK